MDLQPIIALIGVFGLLLLVLAADRIRKTRYLAAIGAAIAGLVLLGAASLLLRVSLNIGTYAPLSGEQAAAELLFETRGPQRFRTTITRIPGGETQIVVLSGDDCQVDARLLRWRGWATQFGVAARYRLERITGRYRALEDQRLRPRSVFRLSENPGTDLWILAIDHPDWIAVVDAGYASSAPLPMVDGARFQVAVTPTGLVARPLNTTARAIFARSP